LPEFCLREPLLRRCFGPPSSDVGVAVVFVAVVAWSSSVTDVVLGSTSGSCCRACDAPSRMLCRVGFGGRLGRLSVVSLPSRLHLLSWLHRVVATYRAGCVVRLVVEGHVFHFLAALLWLLFRLLTTYSVDL
jgi:hypothetical protein